MGRDCHKRILFLEQLRSLRRQRRDRTLSWQKHRWHEIRRGDSGMAEQMGNAIVPPACRPDRLGNAMDRAEWSLWMENHSFQRKQDFRAQKPVI